MGVIKLYAADGETKIYCFRLDQPLQAVFQGEEVEIYSPGSTVSMHAPLLPMCLCENGKLRVGDITYILHEGISKGLYCLNILILYSSETKQPVAHASDNEQNHG